VRRVAEALLFPAPLAGGLYLVALRLGLVAARPDAVWWLAAFPVAALVLAFRVRATRLVMAALVELTLCMALHQLVTFIHAWRLD
jgi:hypothetical protein